MDKMAIPWDILVNSVNPVRAGEDLSHWSNLAYDLWRSVTSVPLTLNI